MVLFQVDPFPPTDIEGIAITNFAQAVIHLSIIVMFIILILYLFNKSNNTFNDGVPILIVFLFSLLIGIESFEHLHTPFSPSFEIFFLIFQTSIFLLTAFNIYDNKIKRR